MPREQVYPLTILLETIGALLRSLAIWFFTFPIVLILFFVRVGVIAYRWKDGVLFAADWGRIITQAAALPFVLWLVAGLLIGFFPIIYSLLTHYFWQDGLEVAESLGARKPTDRGELPKIQEVLRTLTAQGMGNKKAPKAWMIVDTPAINSFTIGRVIYLTRGLINSPHLGAAMAHELGHLHYEDGVWILALRRLTIPLPYWMGIDREVTAGGVVMGNEQHQVSITDDAKFYYKMKTLQMRIVLGLVCGGLGVMFTAQQWAGVWRVWDFDADKFAHNLGYGAQLLKLLQEWKEFDTAQPFYLRGRPYTAERIERLQDWSEKQARTEAAAIEAAARRQAEREALEASLAAVQEFTRRLLITLDDESKYNTLKELINPEGKVPSRSNSTWILDDLHKARSNGHRSPYIRLVDRIQRDFAELGIELDAEGNAAKTNSLTGTTSL
jgi:Zn-dependent protease with chaperone function